MNATIDLVAMVERVRIRSEATGANVLWDTQEDSAKWVSLRIYQCSSMKSLSVAIQDLSHSKEYGRLELVETVRISKRIKVKWKVQVTPKTTTLARKERH